MPTSSESDARRLAHRVLLLQGLVGLVVALVCLAWGQRGFTSALAGAVTGVIANLYMTFRALTPARTPQAALGRLYLGQFIKVAVTLIGLFGSAMLLNRRHELVLGALLAGYVGVLVVSWTVPFLSLRRGAPRGPQAGAGGGAA